MVLLRCSKSSCELLEMLGRKKSQVISEAEMLPTLISRQLLSKSPFISLVVHFVDNDGVADSIIKGYSDVSAMRDMLQVYIGQETEQALASWVARVPSPSNSGDGPSRLKKHDFDGLDSGLGRTVEALAILAKLVDQLTQK